MEKKPRIDSDIHAEAFSFSRPPSLEPLTQEEEERIVFGAVNGNSDDFGRLVEQYGNKVYRHVYFMVGNHQDAEDIAGATLMRAMEAITRYEQRGVPIEPWFIRIAHNLGVNHLKSKRYKVVPLVEELLHGWEQSAEEEVFEDFSQRERSEKLQEAISSIRDDEATVIVRKLAGVSNTQIAEELKTSVGAVRVLKCRGLKGLREHLGVNLSSGSAEAFE